MRRNRLPLTLTARLALLTLLALGVADAAECRPQPLAGIAVTVCRVDLAHETLSLFRADSSGRTFGGFSALSSALRTQNLDLVFAMNAGMYEPDRSPVGLFIAEGRELHPLNLGAGTGNFFQPPNGVLLWDRQAARVLATYEYLSENPKPLFAAQSGPMLVHQGQITNSAVMNPQSRSRKIRNGVCAANATQVVFAISEQPVSFYEFARVFRDGLQCSEALYLDGTVSSLYFPPLQRNDQRDRLGPIVGVVRKTARAPRVAR